ncbi:MarR family winged helix-turn-helix transcriptional regulator [Pseudonocardia acaciae]|uniref:MarR family winged helix-turn-helix transcriptional regulator n=1 Tax=Pseudonocardia acaciae TaxID=551276 RepID=UPI000569E699|nr:MarR family transcriptional regulator [Pseudonocardia acaciae]
MAELTGQPERIGLAAALVRLSHVVLHLYGEVSRELGLTPQQAQLLCQLIAGPVGMADLGRALHLGKSGVTGLVDRLERRALVARATDPRDRRAFRITLTPEGARLADEAHREVTARLDKLTGELAPADRDRLVDAIGNLMAGC